MKIDFEMLDTMLKAGATGQVIVDYLRLEEKRRGPKRARDRMAKQAKAKRPKATTSETETKPREIDEQLTPSQIAEKELFRRGKQVLGKTCGGMVTNLVKICKYDLGEARRLIEIAATKQDPREYIVGSMKEKGNGTGNDLMAAFDDLIGRAAGGQVSGDSEMVDVSPKRT